ncbi:MAG: TadE/TadG family protein [Bradyrhizobium sp.]|uniref:TadE/TadG family type IV pilus assembly protein n=1 Tax=Bradyrhizobium sp. TaxID=376 RepID=UPI0025BE26AA|nr:TadE/TadG family type IV pilus assembly protein [Bradyrhizobium sp.]MBI5264873.1 TadE/TadG family protein [Bradyrhizobium sp.]
MPRVSVPRSLLARFASAEHGNIAVIFAIALIPVLTLIGAAIDYSRAVRARTSMQSALDSAALMVAKDLNAGTITEADIESKARLYFQGLYVPKDAIYSTADIRATYTAKDDKGASNIVMNASGYIYTEFMKLTGFQTMEFSTKSTSKWGDTRLRVALALDTTGSMSSDEKMPNLKSAAKTMVDQLSNLNHTTGDVYISLIPFSRDVNIGSGNTTYVNWDKWESEPANIKTTKPANWQNYGPGSKCPFSSQSHGFRCVTTPVNGSASTSTIPSSGTYKGYICPGLDNSSRNYYNGCYSSVDLGTTTTRTFCTGGSCSCSFDKGMIGGTGSTCSCNTVNWTKTCTETVRNYKHDWVINDHSTWNGCVIDRDQNYDTTKDVPTLGDPAKMFYAEQYASCSPALTAMSNSWSALKSSIDGLYPAGNTNQAIGAAWGWFSLSQTAPLSAPSKENGYSYQDYLVLVSDGMNTQNRWTSDQNTIDARQKILCDNIKKANVQIFAIQINTSTSSPDPTSAVLQYCASSPAYFQMITSAGQTAAAFQNVTTQISRLHVAQ